MNEPFDKIEDEYMEGLENDEALEHFQIDALEYARKTMRCETCTKLNRNRCKIIDENFSALDWSGDQIVFSESFKDKYRIKFGCIFYEEKTNET
jgi:hypothetical protein